MLSDVATLSSLVQQAPALAVALCALLFTGWTWKASRKANREAETRAALSAVRQGKRLGALEKTAALLDMRRRITEEELGERGIRLSPWPPDHPRPYPGDDDDQDVDVGTAHLQTQYFVPPPPASRRTS